MRNVTLLFFLAAMLASNFRSTAQILSEPFTADLNGWTAIGAWTWDANGAADQLGTAVWADRSRIRSASRGGAALYANAETDAQLVSPVISLPNTARELYLSFYLYYRSAGGNPRVRILSGGVPVLEQSILGDLGNGEETSSGYFAIIDLSALPAAGITDIQIEFDVEGPTEFWLLDDISLTATPPVRPTFPQYVGDSLTAYGIRYIVDSTGAPAVPFELVADFKPNVSTADKEAFRRLLKVIGVRSCVCDRLEVWEMGPGIFFDENGQPLGDPSDILERTVGSSSMNEVDGLDLNYYSYNELAGGVAAPNAPLTAALVNAYPPAPTAALRVAILDTGLDLDHPDFGGLLYRDADALGDGNDDDGDCYPDNPLGWNFVDDNNNPDDDNGHGTHVAGIVANNVRDCRECTVQILPYKTHSRNGVGTLFASACATLQAGVSDGADVINASWGFYGGTSTILRSAIDTAGSYGAVFVAAAGNDSLNLVADPQYPASYDLANVLSVGAVDTLPINTYPLAPFSNFNADYVDLAAFGVAVESSTRGGGRGLKSGTSMAAPAVSAAATLYGCQNGGDFSGVAAFLVDDAVLTGGMDLLGKILDRNVLFPELGCPPPTSVAGLSGVVTAFQVSPNPFTDDLYVTALQDLGPAEIIVYRTDGRQVGSRTVSSFAAGSRVTIKLADLPAGQYLVTVAAGGRIRTRRLVKR